MKKVVIGVDVGGTTIKAARLENSMLVKKAQADTGAHREADAIINTLIDVIKRVWSDAVEAIGVGIPGYMDVNGGEIKLINNISSFNGRNIKLELSNTFNIPICVDNDANCFVLGEYYFGAGTRYQNMVGLTLGTGLGGGIIINGKLVSGLYGGAGELGGISYKGKNFEEYCSSKFFKTFYDCTGKDLFIRAENGDVSAQIAFNEFGQHLGRLIVNSVYFIAPEAIIIGGSISKSYKYFIQGVRTVMSTFPAEVIRKGCSIEKAELDNPVLMGAAALCFNKDAFHESPVKCNS